MFPFANAKGFGTHMQSSTKLENKIATWRKQKTFYTYLKI